MHSRLPPIVPGTQPELADIERDIIAERGRVLELYQVLLNSPPVAAGWEKLLTAIRNRSSLAPPLRELVILRVAVLNGARYEFDEHTPNAKRAGVTDAKIAAIRALPKGGADDAGADSPFDADDRLMLALTDAMTRDIVVPETVMQRLEARFDRRGVLEAVATVAAYNMVSRLLVALDIRH